MNNSSLKAKLKQRVKDALSATLWAYDGAALIGKLRQIGLGEGGTLMLHASWLQHNGFRGKPSDLIRALKQAVGPEGLLVMTSMPYHNMSSAEWLAKNKPMNVLRTPSMMGLVSEAFRRSEDVHRSPSVTHPLLAWGRMADSLLAAHDKTLYPFGKGSPFEKLGDALILGYDAPFSTFTYTHYVEDSLADTLPFPLYEAEPKSGIIIDSQGVQHQQSAYVLSATANRQRREASLVAHLEKHGSLHHDRIGHTSLTWIRACDLFDGAHGLVRGGSHFFAPLPNPQHH